MTASADSNSGDGVVVVIAAGRTPTASLVETVDSALASALDGLRVMVILSRGDARRDELALLVGADPRVELATVGDADPVAEVVIELPPRARPDPRALAAIVGMIRAQGLGLVAVRVPGIARGTLRATARGSGSRRLRAREVGLRAAGGRRGAPPPQGTLAEERAEHLRHRARSATMRARMDRHAHRYSRERLQLRHERARLRLAEERVGRSGPGRWALWRARGLARRAAQVPGAFAALVRRARGYARRARRFALDRWRSRGPEPSP